MSFTDSLCVAAVLSRAGRSVWMASDVSTLCVRSSTLPASASAEVLEAAFERGRSLGLFTPSSMAKRFEHLGGRGRAGSTAMRELLAAAAPGSLDSLLEVKAWRRLQRSGLELPRRQVLVPLNVAKPRFRLDFAWPDLMVGFETEGFEWHGTRARWKQDRVRTAHLERLGWRIVVATWDDVVKTPEATMERVSLALRERSRLRRQSG